MRRERLEIIKNILETVHDQQSNKTRIVYLANLNFKSANPYLDNLLDKGFILKSEAMYSITTNGLEFLRETKAILEALGP
jgi:predicted transcriptional regulator